MLAVADRWPARQVFIVCAVASAGCTVAAMLVVPHVEALHVLRALTGLCLAGVYPVGMKLAALFFPQGLGAAMGWLVGALVLGTASAHAVRAISVAGYGLPWQVVFITVAAASLLAAWAVWKLLPNPSARTAAQNADEHSHRSGRGSVAPKWPLHGLTALTCIATDSRLRASAAGYFGHMWELYTLWVLVPVVLAARLTTSVEVSAWAFAVLAAGAIGCVGGGLLARRWGSARVAVAQLTTSALCCLMSPWMLNAPLGLFLVWMLVWGITVAGDSPQFSALTAQNAPPHVLGSVLTLVNSVGFAVSAISIEVFVRAAGVQPLGKVLPWLAVGPVLGLVCMVPLLKRTSR